ncbi:hypothetical protein M4578_04965 [Salipiger sp. P9]|uniref:hypothetical protein n=1 Tax=Salipiger pentaromativorans TaxID=2943193 RepID=UPI002158419E|nr:hypothetical protein [Salipiger pentaromativorans]MCR8547167.1 hypothetical protein [Salipiger pentaromativorans]
MQNDPIDIRCPKCGHVAHFHEPFRFTCVIRYAEVPENAHLWGRVVVEELYPEHYHWHQPETPKPTFHQGKETGPGYRLNHRGMRECACCGTLEKATISWPEDAYWQWNIDGHQLVARNREHAEMILAYLRERKRVPNRKPALRNIPTVMLTKQFAPVVQDHVERALEQA